MIFDGFLFNLRTIFTIINLNILLNKKGDLYRFVYDLITIQVITNLYITFKTEGRNYNNLSTEYVIIIL